MEKEHLIIKSINKVSAYSKNHRSNIKSNNPSCDNKNKTISSHYTECIRDVYVSREL